MGATIGLIVFGAWMILTEFVHTDLVVCRTLVMALMVFLQNAHALNCRSEKISMFKLSYKSNWFFVVAVLASVGLQILFMEIASLSVLLELTTVDYGTLAILLGISCVALVIGEIYKAIIRKREQKLNK
jgi:magnesium-transporting ATPase (P-type)